MTFDDEDLVDLSDLYRKTGYNPTDTLGNSGLYQNNNLPFLAGTHPDTGQVGFNPSAYLGRSDKGISVEEILAHEFEHSRQVKSTKKRSDYVDGQLFKAINKARDLPGGETFNTQYNTDELLAFLRGKEATKSLPNNYYQELDRHVKGSYGGGASLWDTLERILGGNPTKHYIETQMYPGYDKIVETPRYQQLYQDTKNKLQKFIKR